MHPVICQFGPFTIYAYGLMVALAVLVCGPLFARDMDRLGFSCEIAYDFIFWIMGFGILGARMFFIFLNFSFFLHDPMEIVMLAHGGLAWQGGFIAGVIATFFFVRRKKIDVRILLDTAAPYLALGQAIGRVGCLLNGCCYGRPVNWGLFFPSIGARLHPTQIYMTFSLLVLFVILKRLKPVVKIPGHLFALYVLIDSIFRFVIEFWRADHTSLALGLSIFQFVCLFFIGIASYVLSRPHHRSRR